MTKQPKIDAVDKEIKAILKKNGMKVGYKISFPIYRQLPDEVQLALSVLSKHGMKIELTIDPVSKSN